MTSFDHLLDIVLAGGHRATLIILAAAVSTVWGMINLFRRSDCSTILPQLAVSLLPAIIGLYGFYKIWESYSVVAMSSIAPRKSEFDHIVSHAISYGMLGLIGTMLAVATSIACLLRQARRDGEFRMADSISHE